MPTHAKYSLSLTLRSGLFLWLACHPVHWASAQLEATRQERASGGQSQAIRVMSFNIRYGKARDGDNRWDLRKQLVAQTIRTFAPDLLGLQEIMPFQAEYLREQLPEYEYVGWSRSQNPDDEQCGILFRKSRFTSQESGQFWLSETPDVKASKSWDSSLPRVATWVVLSDRTTGRSLRLINTHFDHRGQTARREAAKLLANKTREANLPLIIAGDFNCAIASQPYQQLVNDQTELVDSYRARHPKAHAEEGTFNGFQGTRTGARIDWILHSRHFLTQEAEIDTTHIGSRYPSDHFPVTAQLELRNP